MQLLASEPSSADPETLNPASGGLLPHRFTLACGPAVVDVLQVSLLDATALAPPAVSFLWHFPWRCSTGFSLCLLWPTILNSQLAHRLKSVLRRPLALPGALPFTLGPLQSGRRVFPIARDGVRTFLPFA